MSEQVVIIDMELEGSDVTEVLRPAEQSEFAALAEAAERETFQEIVAEIDAKVDPTAEKELRAKAFRKTSGHGNFLWTLETVG